MPTEAKFSSTMRSAYGCIVHPKRCLISVHFQAHQFAHYDYKSRKTIPAKDFAHSIVASADLSHLGRLLERVDELSNDPRFRDVRITFDEFKNFAELRKKLSPFSSGIFSFAEVQGLLTRDDFQRAASHVGHIFLAHFNKDDD